jgi:hypothetical protein
MTNALTIYSQFDQLQRAALALQKSGYFQDVKSEAQAIVKVMAGAELGLPPFASMTGIHIIQGKPVLGANVIATLVKNDPRYDYRVKVASDTDCQLEWYEGGKPVGVIGFAMREAQAAGLTGKDNWKKYPSDMLFARAISRGARRFAPGIFGGSPVYTPDEMGFEVDEEGSVIVDAEIIEPEQSHPSEPMTYAEACDVENSKGERYGDLDNATLAIMANAIRKAKTPKPEHSLKLQAIDLILAERNNAPPEPEPTESNGEQFEF